MVLSHAPVTIPSRKMRTNVRNMNVFIEQLLAFHEPAGTRRWKFQGYDY
jgi:hypothetical protein